MPSTPVVSVITPVQNTLPYLGHWFESLLGQTLDRSRIEVIAVDDGSDDGSGPELDRLAAAHPDLLTVLRLADPGGPARARNRALDRAAGRYVYFVDSDDHLGPEALERTTDYADAHGSDIVLGRMTGVNGRQVMDSLYRSTVADLPFPGTVLLWSLNVTKLYRRCFLERYRLRFREDLPVYSDQPFALEAYARSGLTSVYADYPCYYLRKRPDESNITLRAHPEDRLRAIEAIMATSVGLTEPGPRRAALFRRHLSSELLPLVGPPLLDLDPPVRRRILRGAAILASRHAGDYTLDELTPAQRRRLQLLRHGLFDELLHLLRHEAVHHAPPAPLRVTAVAWRPDPGGVPALTVSAEGTGTARALPVALPAPLPLPRPTAGTPGPGSPAIGTPRQPVPVGSPAPGGGPLTASVPFLALLPVPGEPAGCWAIRLESEHAGLRELLPVPAPVPALPPQRLWHRGLPYLAGPVDHPDGGLVLLVQRIGLGRGLRLGAGWRLRRARRTLTAHLRRSPAAPAAAVAPAPARVPAASATGTAPTTAPAAPTPPAPSVAPGQSAAPVPSTAPATSPPS